MVIEILQTLIDSLNGDIEVLVQIDGLIHGFANPVNQRYFEGLLTWVSLIKLDGDHEVINLSVDF